MNRSAWQSLHGDLDLARGHGRRSKGYLSATAPWARVWEQRLGRLTVRLEHAFEHHRQVKALMLSLLLIGLLAVIDVLTGPELAFSFFYLLPVSVALWFSVPVVGLFVSLLSACAWLGADIAAGNRYDGLFVPLWNTGMRFGFFLVVTLLLTDIKRRMIREQAHARLDPLTGLYNRRYLEETLERELSRAARSDTSVSLLVFDVDHFKKFNDTSGHDAGDTVLRELGGLVRQHLRGGEEFVVVLPGASLEVAEGRAQGLREAVKCLGLTHRSTALGTNSFTVGRGGLLSAARRLGGDAHPGGRRGALPG